MMNIYSEYRFLPENAVLPDSALKVLGLHADGFYFFVSDSNQIYYSLIVGAKTGYSFDEANSFIAEQAGILFLPVSHVFIQPETSVPVSPELLRDNPAHDLYYYCQPLSPGSELLETRIEGAGLSLISSFSSNTLESVRYHRLPVFDWAATWLKKISKVSDDERVHVYVLPSLFWIAVFKNGKVQLFNSFEYQAKSDFLYFLLGSIKAAEINQESAVIRLSGEIAPSSVLAEAIQPYFLSVEYDTAGYIGNEEMRLLSMQLFPLFDS
jgi:hypothetical protein